MKFSDIPGHDRAKQRLKEMASSGRVPHAILIHGPAGIGKFAIARAFAQLLHCSNPTADGEPCGECQQCRLHQGYNHLDTFFSFPVVKTDDKKDVTSQDYIGEFQEFMKESPWMDIDSWALTFDKKNAHPIIYVTESNFLLRRLSTTGHGSGRKIVLIWLPERMNAECANKMLKIIEEPYDDTIFIMSSDHPEELLPTIRSRCQDVELSRISDNTLAQWIAVHHPEAAAEARSIAHIAEGITSAAESMITSERKTDAVYFELFVRLMRLAYARDVAKLRLWAEDVNSLGRESAVAFFTYCQRLIRENFILNFNNRDINYLTPTEAEFSKRFAPFVNEATAPLIVEHLNKALIDIAGNTAGMFVCFDLAIKVILAFANNKQQ